MNTRNIGAELRARRIEIDPTDDRSLEEIATFLGILAAPQTEEIAEQTEEDRGLQDSTQSAILEANG